MALDFNGIEYQPLWEKFASEYKLSPEQLEKFKLYANLLIFWNDKFNLTAITTLQGIIDNHFKDSLAVADIEDLSSIKIIADIGSGAGFPGIPLKILYPNLGVILMEVTHKKRTFLAEVVKALELKDVNICDLDFRTFIRITEAEVDLFLSRASLDVTELIRLFRPSSPYKNSKLIYFASKDWEVPEDCAKYIKEIKPYKIGYKKRNFVILGA